MLHAQVSIDKFGKYSYDSLRKLQLTYIAIMFMSYMRIFSIN